MVLIDFTEPRWLINYYHIVGLVSLILNLFGIYLLVFECKKLGFFRYYLLEFQIVCTITDFHVNCLTQPVPLNPLLSIYTVGILSKYFNVSSHVCAVFGGFIALAQLESLIACFAKKHQAVSMILKTHVVPVFIVYLCYFLCSISPFVLSDFIQYLYVSEDDQLRYILQNYPEQYQDFLKLSHFVLYIKTSNTNWLIYLILIGGFGLSCIFLSFIIDLFRLMQVLKLKLSRSTYQKHHEAVQSLMVQFISSSLCLGPPCILVVIVFLEIDNGQTISNFLIAWFTSHSSVNMISLFFFFPPYRKFFVKHAKRKQKRINAAASSVLF